MSTMIPRPIGDIFDQFRLETNVAGSDFGGLQLLFHQGQRAQLNSQLAPILATSLVPSCGCGNGLAIKSILNPPHRKPFNLLVTVRKLQ